MVSTTLDILLNLARVDETRSAVASVQDLLPDLLQAMLVYRDNGKDIFPKCCAVLQTLAVCPEVRLFLMHKSIGQFKSTQRIATLSRLN